MNATIDTPASFTADDPQNVGWKVEHDWSVALEARDSRLDAKTYETLISAIRMGLPVILTRRGSLGVETSTVVVTAMHVHESSPSASRIRVRYWGFGHEVWLGEIVSITTPEVTYHD